MSMAFPLYLALTASEILNIDTPPRPYAWMACHYSCYSTGLSNLPDTLTPGSMVILNDRTPPCGHDPAFIAMQLSELVEVFSVDSVLLDLQRPDLEENARIAACIAETLTCPVGVSALYGETLPCPVFLPPVPPHKSLQDYLSPWVGREIWLDAATSREQITVTAEGSRIEPAQSVSVSGFEEENLHCHYCIDICEDRAVFNLWRTPEDLTALLQEAEALGVTKAIGLYQELGEKNGASNARPCK